MEFEIVILAAGRGSRLGDRTRNVPKCLLEVAPGTSLLDMQLATLLRLFPASKITIAAGYKSEKIESHVRAKYTNVSINLLEIEAYDAYNNAHTLRQTLAKLDRNASVLQLNSDLFFDENILGEAQKEIPDFLSGEAHIFVQEKSCGEEEMKVKLRQDGSIESINKKIAPHAATGEAFGINYYGADFIKSFIPALDEVIKRSPNAYFEDALDSLFATSTAGKMYSANNGYAIEVDFPADLDAARAQFSALKTYPVDE